MSRKLFLNIGSFFKIHLLFFPLVIASILGGYYASFFMAYGSALIHEAGHIITARLFGVAVSHIEILPFGVCGKLKDDYIKKPDCEIIISLCGPVVSFVIAFSVFLCRNYISEALYNCIFPLNLLLGIINLIPALPLDGGRIFRASLTKKFGIIPAIKISLFVSAFFTGLILFLSIYGLLTHSFNFSLILIGSFLLGNLCVEQKTVSKTVLNEVLTYKDKLDKKDFYKTTVITAPLTTPGRKILKKLSYDRYHIIYATDNALNIKKVLTEGQIINALTEQGSNITLNEI